MKIFDGLRSLAFAFAVCGLMAGCYCPRSTEPTATSMWMLMTDLAQRDHAPVDLIVIGQDIVEHYGTEKAWNTVIVKWYETSNYAPLEKANDVMWLNDQSARVRDLGWLIHFRDEWCHESLIHDHLKARLHTRNHDP